MHDMESALNSKHGSDIREQAAEWYLARKGGLDPARMQQFARWLATSPRHLAEYHSIERIGRDLPIAVHPAASADELIERVRAADDDDDTVVRFIAPRRASTRSAGRGRGRTWAVAAVLAFLAVDVVVLWQYFARPTAEQIVSSEVGEPGRQWQLDGDTSLQLDTNSAVDISAYDAGNRLVRQLYGQVNYSARHDPARPRFQVDAGDVQVQDVGTRFGIYMMEKATRITVLEGEVEVSIKGVPGTRLVVQGEQLDVVPGQAPGEPAKVDAAKVMGWASGEIRFDDVRLADATEEINRYLQKRFRIESPTMRDQLINYTFPVGDAESFRNYLLKTQGARVEEGTDRIVVTHR